LCKKTLERKEGSPEGLYSSEGDAWAWAWRVSDRKEDETMIALVSYRIGIMHPMGISRKNNEPR